MRSSEASKNVLLGEKDICAEKAWAGLERGCCVLLCYNHLYGGSSSGFLWLNHFALSGFESALGLTQGPPSTILAKLDSSASVSGKLTEYSIIWRPFPEDPFCTCLA